MCKELELIFLYSNYAFHNIQLLEEKLKCKVSNYQSSCEQLQKYYTYLKT